MTTNEQIARDLDTLYTTIHSEGVKALRGGKENLDHHLQNVERDSRRGLTLLVNLNGLMSENYGLLVKEMRGVEPRQYYYPETDLHVTVLTLISAGAHFHSNEVINDKIMQIINFATLNVKPFEIEFRGIILSNGAIIIKGYYQEGLHELRDNIRRFATQYGFKPKERYQSISAHVTFGRFVSKLENRNKFLKKIETYQDFKIGAVQVEQMELVIHDWYNSRKNVLQKFHLEHF